VATSLHEKCLESVETVLKALSLDGIGQNVLRRLLEDDAPEALPFAMVTIEGGVTTLRQLTSAAREVELPVRVRLVAPLGASSGRDQSGGWTAWQEQLMAAFPDARAPGYPDQVYGCRVVSVEAALPQQRASMRVAGAVDVRFRGLLPGG
jgi:hypothetical protein